MVTRPFWRTGPLATRSINSARVQLPSNALKRGNTSLTGKTVKNGERLGCDVCPQCSKRCLVTGHVRAMHTVSRKFAW